MRLVGLGKEERYRFAYEIVYPAARCCMLTAKLKEEGQRTRRDTADERVGVFGQTMELGLGSESVWSDSEELCVSEFIIGGGGKMFQSQAAWPGCELLRGSSLVREKDEGEDLGAISRRE